jgi:hypothetical protein
VNLLSKFIRLGLVAVTFWSFSIHATTFVPISVGNITIIIPVNNVPEAKNDLVANIPERHVDLDVPISVIGNDIDENPAGLLVSLVSNVSANGQPLTVSSDNQTVIYTTLPGWNGTDTFQYQLTDDDGQQSNIATATVMFVDANDPPTAVEDRLSITPNANCNENTPHSELIYYVNNCSYPLGNLMANDSDDGGSAALRFGRYIFFFTGQARGSAAFISGTDQEYYPTRHGFVAITPTGDVEYVAFPSFFGSDADPTKSVGSRPHPSAGLDYFDYTAMDAEGLESDEALFVINIEDNNARPIVTSVFPVEGAQVSSETPIVAQANASDNGSISRVEFSLDGGASWQLATGTYQFNYGTQPAGDYTVLYRATDNQNRNSVVQSVSFSVVNIPNVIPQVTSYSVSPSAPYTTNDNISASAVATDSDGVVYAVEFRLDSGAWVADDSAPYSADFGVLSAGSHTIQYRAKDNVGAYSVIQSRTVNVSQAVLRRIFEVATSAIRVGESTTVTWDVETANSCVLMQGTNVVASNLASSGSRTVRLFDSGSLTLSLQCQANNGGAITPITQNITVNKLSAPTLDQPVVQ